MKELWYSLLAIFWAVSGSAQDTEIRATELVGWDRTETHAPYPPDPFGDRFSGIRTGVSAKTVVGGSVVPMYQDPSSQQMYAFRTQSDYPDYDSGVPNRGIAIAAGEAVPRNFAGLGLEVRYLRGGGCFPASENYDVSDPSSAPCLKEVNADGTEYTVLKRREYWRARFMHINPDTGEEHLDGESSTFWTTLNNGATCMEPYLYGCILTGYSQNEISKWMSGTGINCSMPMGGWYRVELYYQYSRYKAGETIPEGQDEFVPATVPATATKLSVPGHLIWSQEFALGPGENALRARLERSRINPAVPERYPNPGVTNVGGLKIDQIDPGQTRVIVEAGECGEPYLGVTFTGSIDYLEGSGGHLHINSNEVTPPTQAIEKTIGTVSNASGIDISGTIGFSGEWISEPIVAGTFAGEYEITVESPNVVPTNVNVGTMTFPKSVGPLKLTVGFDKLVHLYDLGPVPGVFSVGTNNSNNCVSQQCDNHRDLSQFAHPKLIAFIGHVALEYRKKVDPDGLLPINDISLPMGGAFEFPGNWKLKEHISHRIGIDFDVNRNADLGGVTYSINPINEAKLNKIVDNFGGLKMKEPTIHYRLPQALIDNIAGEIK